MTPPEPLPHLDLDRLQARDPAAVTAWFDAFADAVYGFVFHRVGRDPDLAADITQETFTDALGRIGDFDPDRGRMFPWLTYTARNAIRKANRHRLRHLHDLDHGLRVEPRIAAALADLEDAPLAESIVERAETAEMVRVALSELPVRHQRVLRSRYFEQLSIREIADAEAISQGAAKVLLHRARRAFQTAFEGIVARLAGVPERREMP
jgi:RNA polymerase sigma-70 factor (ECF subfamily)